MAGNRQQFHSGRGVAGLFVSFVLNTLSASVAGCEELGRMTFDFFSFLSFFLLLLLYGVKIGALQQGRYLALKISREETTRKREGVITFPRCREQRLVRGGVPGR